VLGSPDVTVSIVWYPSHMVTARKEAAKTMGKIDVVIEVLDARVPLSSRNPAVETLRAQTKRPALKLLNKSDLADRERTREWLAYYNAQPGVKAIALNSKKPREVTRVTREAATLAPGRGSPDKPLRMMILGIPNVGKSTLMNALLERRLAKVGDEPAITKMNMGHKLGDGMWLIDTPGLLWPGLEEETATKLAATHSIGRNAYDQQSVAGELGQYLLEHYPALLAARYGALDDTTDGHGLLTAIAQRRSLLAKGGGPDLQKASLVLLNDFRAGTLGPITLETVDAVGTARR
jgi:ribosome biogenesis GTPase A